MSKELSLNKLRWPRREIVRAKRLYYMRVGGMDIDPTATFSLSATFDKTNPRGLHIGARSIFLPGLTVGDESIVAAGSVVTKDVPPHSIAAGNPEQIIRRNARIGPFGQTVKRKPLPKTKLTIAGGAD
jgi:hypothetical protein